MPKIVEHITYEEYLKLKKNSTKLINKRTSLRRLLKLLEQDPELIDYLYIYQTFPKFTKEGVYSMYLQL